MTRNTYKLALSWGFVAFLLSSSPAAASDELKELVFKNCDEASIQSQALAPAEKREFFSYLQRVLELKLEKPKSPIFQPQLPGQPSSFANNTVQTVQKLEVLQGYDSERERESKTCALRLVRELTPDSFEIIPALIRLLDNPALDESLRQEVNRTVWSVTLKVKTIESYKLLPETVGEIITCLPTAGGYLAEDVIIELQEKFAYPLALELRNPDRIKRKDITDLLLRIDGQGTLIGPALVSLLNSSDSNLRLKSILLLGDLPAFYSEAIPTLLKTLNDPASEVSKAAYISLNKVFSRPEILSAYGNKSELFSSLLIALEMPSSEGRNILAKGLKLLVNSDTQAKEKLLKALPTRDPELKAHVIELLGAIRPPQADIASQAAELLYDPESKVRLSAIDCLVAHDKPENAVKTLIRFLKSSKSEQDPLVKEEFIHQVAESSMRLSPEQVSSFVPYFVDALSFHAPDESSSKKASSNHFAVQALAHAGSIAEKPLIKALRDKDSFVRRNAIIVLSELHPTSKDTIKAIAQTLRDEDPSVRGAGVQALIQVGPNVETEVTKALQWKEDHARYAAAQVLAYLGKASPAIAEIMMQAYRKARCAEKFPYVAQIIRLREALKPDVEQELIRCLKDPTAQQNEILAALGRLAPLSIEAKDLVTLLLREKSLNDITALLILEDGKRLGLVDEDIFKFTQNFLQSANNITKAHAIGVLAKLKNTALPAIEFLNSTVADETQELLIRNQAAAAIAQIDSSSTTPRQFFLSELGGDSVQYAISSLRDLPASTSIPIAQEALRTLPEAKHVRILRLLGDFGSEAKEALPLITEKLSSPTPEVQIQALVALMRIDPLNNQIVPMLRQTITGSGRLLLEKEAYPKESMVAFQEILKSPNNLVESKFASEILSRQNN